jgi:hypothetical protein
MAETDHKTVTFRCQSELEHLLPRPIPAALGLPGWYKALPQKVFDPTDGKQAKAVKKCPPFIDAMTYGFLIPLAMDLEIRDGEFFWDLDVPAGFVSEYSHSPIDFHDPSQVAGTPFFDDDRFIIKFNNFWTIEAPPGYSLLITHPVNRADLPFTTLTGLVDCDTFHDVPINFPARWHDVNFNGVLPKGTPVAQCLPLDRAIWSAQYEPMSGEALSRFVETKDALRSQDDVYRRQYRVAKR